MGALAELAAREGRMREVELLAVLPQAVREGKMREVDVRWR